jgi:hypothetical protein
MNPHWWRRSTSIDAINTKRTGTAQAVTGAPSADSGLRVVHAVQVGDQTPMKPVAPVTKMRMMFSPKSHEKQSQ